MSEGNQLLSRRISQSTVKNHTGTHPREFFIMQNLPVLNLVIESLGNPNSSGPSPISSPSRPNDQNSVVVSAAVKPLPSNLPSEESRLNVAEGFQSNGFPTNGKLIRDQAKVALRQLYDRNIVFDEIVAENIDASCVKELYLEIGLAVPTSPHRQQLDTSTILTRSVSAQPAPFLDGSSLSTPSQKVSGTTPPAIASQKVERRVSEHNDMILGVNSSQPSITKSDDATEFAVESNAKKADTVKEASPILQASTAHTTKKSTFPPPGDKLDRKDYIAKMLAAKTGKSITAPKVGKPAETPVTQAQMKEVAMNMNVGSEKMTMSFPESVMASSDKEIELGNKRKAQTDLARRRIDALNSRIVTSSKPNNEVGSVDSPFAIASITPPTEPHDQVLSSGRDVPTPLQLQPLQHAATISAPQSQFTPSSSFFSSLGWKPPSGLPGLFAFPGFSPTTTDSKEPEIASTVTDRQPISVRPVESPQVMDALQPNSNPISPKGEAIILDPVDSPIPSDHSDVDESVSRDMEQVSEVGKAQDSDYIGADMELATPATQLQHELENHSKTDDTIRQETEPPSFTPSSPQQFTPSREQTRKRPTASDFIENSGVRIKRRMGSNDHPRVLIELSEEEDDTDDDHMDIDDIPTPGTHRPNPSQNPESLKAKSIRDLPALSDFSSRVRGGVSSAMNTPPLVQTPGKALEQERLKQKEEQILLMQRKIAEMEQRRRAKQSMSRAQTPAFSGTPVPEVPPATPEKRMELLSPVDQPVKATVQQIEGQQYVEQLAVQQGDAQRVAEEEKERLEKLQLEANAKAIAAKELEERTAREEAARVSQAAEMQIRRERKIALQIALPDLDQQMERSRLKLEEMKKEIAELEAELQRGVEGRRSIIEELGGINDSEIEDKSDANQIPSRISNLMIETVSIPEPGKCSLLNRISLLSHSFAS